MDFEVTDIDDSTPEVAELPVTAAKWSIRHGAIEYGSYPRRIRISHDDRGNYLVSCWKDHDRMGVELFEDIKDAMDYAETRYGSIG